MPGNNPRDLAALVLLIVLLLFVRMVGPSDVYDNAQPGPMAHTIDVAVNGQWLMQREPSGELATKPPMYPWLAAMGVIITGLTNEWVLKLPSIIAFLVVTVVVYDLGRRSLGLSGGVLAAAMWACNYHAFKLMYTARPDMLVTMFIVIGVWSVQLQRKAWSVGGLSSIRGRPGVWLIVVFWLAVAGALLTKGPPAMLAIAWLCIAVVSDGAWRRSRPAWQTLGLVVAVAIVGAWFIPMLKAYPQWMDNINREVVERTTGTGSGAHRNTPVLAIPAYFLGRFAPWSLLCVLAAVTFHRWRSHLRASVSPANLQWTLWWIGLVLVVFMIPKGRRADYILPAYVGGSVLAAAMIMQAGDEIGRWHRVVGVFLGAIGVIVIVAVPVCLHSLFPGVMELPAIIPFAGQGATGVVLVCVVVMFVAYMVIHSYRRYRIRAMGAVFVVAGLLGVHHFGYSRAAKTHGGDYVHSVVQQTRIAAEATSLPVVFHDIDKTPVESLLGSNQVNGKSFPTIGTEGALLVTSGRAWAEHEGSYASRADVLIQTAQVPEAKVKLTVVRIEPLVRKKAAHE